MSVLIVYATIEGQSGKIAQFVKTHLEGTGQTVRCFDTDDLLADVEFEGVSHVIVTAPVHERRHPPSFELFINASSDALEARPTLLLSVSLNAAFEDGLGEAQDYVDEMALRTGFRPTQTALIAGAVKSGSYDYFATQVVRHVLLADRPFDPSEGDREFTDWESLKADVARFVTT